VDANTTDHDALNQILKSSDTIASSTYDTFVMDSDHIHWITPEFGVFGGSYTSSPLERISTDRIVFGIATDKAESIQDPRSIAGISMSWDKTEDQRKSFQDLEVHDDVHRFNTEAFYGFQIGDNVTIQPSLALTADSIDIDPEFTAHVGVHVRF
jgi:hypothetical protein